jgi:hypothetical protein
MGWPVSGDVHPEPRSSYQLRTHLRDVHGDDRRGAAWVDLVRLHDHAHDHHDPGHVHEKGG